MEKLIFRREYPSAGSNAKVQFGEIKAAKSLVPLQSLFKEKHRKRIIKKIFNNQHSEFDKFLSRLEPIHSWKEAYQQIDEELTKRKFDAKKEEGVLFANIIYRRYFPNDDEVELE